MAREENTHLATEAFRDHLATIDEQGKRKWIYARMPQGKLYNIRRFVSYGYFLLFFSLPFLQVNGRPLFLFNVTEGRFILFGVVFWPQDFFIFGLAMVAFILFIVLFTMAFGRLFCGWICPQTIFMELLFRRIEYWIEGDAAAQKMLAKAPWDTEKILKKGGKHFAFLVLSILIANTFLAYIIGLPALVTTITDPLSAHFAGFLAMLAFAVAFYSVFALFREQVCTTICPYGRLQSVLLDKDSVVVAYDYQRGEPRGKYKKEVTHDLGDCIDCMQCVHVCPTGIDIRNGTQLECVNCTACIDACNFMMNKVGRPGNLIRYASENNIANRSPLKFTPRLRIYSLLLLMITGAIIYLLASRQPVSGTIIRTTGMLYQERGTDSISNLYRIKLVNKTVLPVSLQLKLEDTAGHIEVIGKPEIRVKAEGQGEGTFFIILSNDLIKKRKSVIQVGLYEKNRQIGVIKTTFLGPVKF